MLHRIAALWLLTISICLGVSVTPAIERVLSDEFERTIDARIVGVTATDVEIIRKADGSRFNFPLAKLSEADRAFAHALLKKIEGSRPLPDTPFVTSLRSDFHVFDPVGKRYVAVPANAFATDPFFVLAFSYQPDVESPFTPRVLRNAKKAPQNDLPLLWIHFGGDDALYALVGDKLPPGHAILSSTARQRGLSNGQKVYNAYTSEWFSRNQRNSSTFLQFSPSDAERTDLIDKLRRSMGAYWLAPQTYFSMGDSSRPSPYCMAVRRDGKLVRFRGVDVTGSRETVTKILNDHASELE